MAEPELELEQAAKADTLEPEPKIEQIESDEATGEETVADEFETVEIDGKPIRVEKAGKEYLLRQADYTTKTQKIAETERTLKADREKFDSLRKEAAEDFEERAKLLLIKQRLNQLGQVDMSALRQQDITAADNLSHEYNQLGREERQLTESLQHKAAIRNREQEREAASLRDQTETELARDIEGWSTGLRDKVHGFATKQLGYDAGDLSRATARDYKTLNLARIGREFLDRKAAAAKTAETAEPVPKIVSRRTTTVRDPDKLSTADWMKWRNDQIRSQS